MCTKNVSYCCEKDGGVRVDANGEGRGCRVGGGGGQGRCERRSEAFVKIQKIYLFIYFIYFFWGEGGRRKEKKYGSAIFMRNPHMKFQDSSYRFTDNHLTGITMQPNDGIIL